MSVRFEEGQDCLEVYIKQEELCLEGIDTRNLQPNDNGEVRVCDVEEDGIIHWYVEEEDAPEVIKAEDLVEIFRVSEDRIPD